MNDGISLAEALHEVRQELYKAQDLAAREQFRFEVEQVELELEVEFRRDASGKVNVEVGAFGVKAIGEGSQATGSTRRQTLTLTLQVRDEAVDGQERAKISRSFGTDARASEVPTRSEASVTRTKTPGPRPWEQ
ncbi:trypco2 family protein [Streptomyces sp. NPDC033538]|uniref:trypco2 family protein n=1 Tax=Streptomyces sp. NPDC033538 TaxID=3155367 RepID=UPI0033E6F047